MRSANTKVVIFLALPILVLMAHIYWIKDQQFAAGQQLNLLEKSFSGSLQRYHYLPKILANKSAYQITNQVNNNSGQLNQLLKLMKETAGVGVIYLMNDQGLVIASSNYDVQSSFIGQNYHFRPYFKNALTYGTGSYYGVGVTSGIPGYFLSAKVTDSENRVGVITVKIEPSQIDNSWNSAHTNIFITNSDEVILMSNQEAWLYGSLTQLSANQINLIQQQQQFASHVPSSIVEQKIKIDWLALDLWQIGQSYYLINSLPLAASDHGSSKSWVIYASSPYSAVLIKTLYSALVIGLFLLSIYIGLEHKHVLEYAKQREQQSNQRRRAQLQSVIDNTQVGLLTLDSQGLILSANPIFRNMISPRAQPIEGLSIQQFIGSIFTDDELSHFTAGFVETVIENENSVALPIMYSVGSVNIDESVYLVTVVDITKRTKVEQELQYINNRLESLVEQRSKELEVLQKELIREEKMIVLGRMAAVIVHELSQPVVAFKTALASIVIKKQRNDIAGIGDTINNMAPLCDHMQDVIVQLKAFSYRGHSPLVELEINPLLQRVIDQVQPTDLAIIESDLSASLELVTGNSVMLTMAFSNLIKNAIEATEDLAAPQVRISSQQLAQGVEVIIEDNGGAMSSDVAKDLFEPFFTTKTIDQGLGLGLALAKNAIKDSGGTIKLAYDQNSTRFLIWLPNATATKDKQQ